MTDNLHERDKTVGLCNTDNYCSNVLDQDRAWFLPIPGVISSTGYKERVTASVCVSASFSTEDTIDRESKHLLHSQNKGDKSTFVIDMHCIAYPR